MQKLQEFINDENGWSSLFNNSSTITFPLSQTQVDELGKIIDCRLSPENLSCDGEISYKEAIAKGNYLNDVLDELNAYCKQNNLQEPTVWEAW